MYKLICHAAPYYFDFTKSDGIVVVIKTGTIRLSNKTMKELVELFVYYTKHSPINMKGKFCCCSEKPQ